MLMLSVVFVFLVLTLMGMPLFFSFGVAATYACIAGDMPLQIIAQRLMIGMDSFTLLAIPGFVLVGEIMCQGGISKRAVDFSNSLIGHFKGGLSMVAVLTGMVMGGISGSAVADTAAVATVLVPSMEKENYPKDFSSAVVGTAGPLGNIIPPSIPMVVYSMTAGLSLLDLFLAGYIPGMMIGLSLMGLCYFISKRKNYGPPSSYEFSGKNVALTFRRAILALLTPLIIVGGIVSGVFTPTESIYQAQPERTAALGCFPKRRMRPSAAWRSSKGFLILLVKLLIFLIVAVYDIWEDLGAWKILLRDMPMICLQFGEFSKIM